MKSTGVWLTRTAEETEALGAELLGSKSPARSPCRVITLSGDLGAGKSTFARGVLRALGATGAVKSPSYTLMELYDYYRPGFLWLVEWPERAAGRLPPADLGFVFSFTNEGHRIERIEFVAANK